MNWEELDAILKNERYYRNIIAVHLNENNNNGEDLGVQNNNFGNSKERNMVNLIENKRYQKALQIVKAIDNFMDNSSELDIMIYEYKYRQNLFITQIAWRTHYSEATVKKKLKKIRLWFIEYLQYTKYPS